MRTALERAADLPYDPPMLPFVPLCSPYDPPTFNVKDPSRGSVSEKSAKNHKYKSPCYPV